MEAFSMTFETSDRVGRCSGLDHRLNLRGMSTDPPCSSVGWPGVVVHKSPTLESVQSRAKLTTDPTHPRIALRSVVDMRSSRRQAAILATAAALVLSAPWQAQAQTSSQSNAFDDTVVAPSPNQNSRDDGDGSERYTCAELNLHNVSVFGHDDVFCVVDAPCYGSMDYYNGTACPTAGAVALSGNTTLVSGSCCAPFPNGTLGCMPLGDDQQVYTQPRCLQLSPDDNEDDDETIQIPPEMLGWSASSDSASQSTGSSHSGPAYTIVVVSSASSSSGEEDSGQVEYPVSRRGSESVSFTSDYGSAAAGDLTSSSSKTSASSSSSGSGATETPSASTGAPTTTSSGQSSYVSTSTSGSNTDAGTGSKHSSASSTAKSSQDDSTGSSIAGSAGIEASSSATSSVPDAGSSGSTASASTSTPSSAASSTASSKSATTTTPAPTGTAYLPTIPAVIESSSSSTSSANTTASSSSQNSTYSTSTSSESSNVANMPMFVIVGLSACSAVVFGAFLLRRTVKPPSQSEATVMMHSGSPEHESTGVSSMYMQAFSSPRLVRTSV